MPTCTPPPALALLSPAPPPSRTPPTHPHRWTATGTLYLTTTRLVFIAGGPPDPSGLVAFALPLVDLSPSTEFVQPIFAANNLAGTCAGGGGDAHMAGRDGPAGRGPGRGGAEGGAHGW